MVDSLTEVIQKPMKEPTFKDILDAAQRKSERLGYLKDGKVTEKGWEVFEQRWREHCARKPN